MHGPQRLLHPLRRTGPKGSGQFAPISWDAALDEIHARVSAVIERWGPQAVMPLNYAGPHGLLAGDSMSLRFFHKLGATQLYRRSLCGGVRSEAWAGTYGAVPGMSAGVRPSTPSSTSSGATTRPSPTCTLSARVRQAKRRGGKLVVVDPLRTKIAEQADLHLALLPGTDVLLAWSRWPRNSNGSGALDHGLHRRACARLRRVHGAGARVAGRARGASLRSAGKPDRHTSRSGWRRPIRWCWRRATGSSAAATAAAASARLIALPALLGKLGKGSGIVLGAGNAFPKTPAQLQRPGPGCPPARARSTSSMSAGTWSPTTSTRRCARCSSTITTRSSCTPTRTGCAAAWRATTSSRSASRWR